MSEDSYGGKRSDPGNDAPHAPPQLSWSAARGRSPGLSQFCWPFWSVLRESQYGWPIEPGHDPGRPTDWMDCDLVPAAGAARVPGREIGREVVREFPAPGGRIRVFAQFGNLFPEIAAKHGVWV